MQGQPVKDIAHVVALNFVSLGDTLQSLSGDDTQAEVVFLSRLSQNARAEKLDQTDIDSVWNIFPPIAKYLGLDYAWKR